MPTYQYRCNRCGHFQEDVCRIGTAPATKRCDQCETDHSLTKLLTGGAGFNAGTRVQYPLKDFQLPPDPTTGRSRIVHSAKEHRELAARAGLVMNQGYERDLVPTR